MAKKKKAEAAKAGAPAWMATFSDLMNLLLCFFVLLFSMSSVDSAKFEAVVASLQSSFSILPAGGASIGDGDRVGAGISQLELQEFNVIFQEMMNSKGQDDAKVEGETTKKAYEEESLAESEEMAEEVTKMLAENNISDQVEVDFNAQYVLLTLNGALLFDSAKSEIRTEALPVVDKIGNVLERYTDRIIEIEGHTDNVPIKNSTFENNDSLSTFRALSVADYLRSNKGLDPTKVKFSGRGEYVPIADNGTDEGRARNRRVEIKLYNTYNSY